MRLLALLPLAAALAACSSSDDGGNNAAAAAPAPAPTGPAPKTPKLDLPPQGADAGDWMKPQAAPNDPKEAPYGNLLDQPVVNGASPKP